MYALVIWTMIGFANGYPVHDWRPLLTGQTVPKTLQACESAAAQLGYKTGQFQCVKVD